MRYRLERRSRWQQTTDENIVTSADGQTDWIDCRGYNRVEFAVSWPSAFAVTGTLALQGRANEFDGTSVTEVDVNVGATDDGAFGSWPDVALNGSPAVVVVEDPMPFMRVAFAHSGGGGGTPLKVIATVSQN